MSKILHRLQVQLLSVLVGDQVWFHWQVMFCVATVEPPWPVTNSLPRPQWYSSEVAYVVRFEKV